MRPKRTGSWMKSSLKSAIAALTLASVSPAEAQTIQTLYSFDNTNGSSPYAGLTLGNDGNFYGTTIGSSLSGTVFQLTTNGTLTALAFFNSNVLNTNGANPLSPLALGSDGNYYGTTELGGIVNSTYTSGMGTVFRVTTNGTLTTLVAFNDTNGSSPYAGLTLGNDGSFYGTTRWGGNLGCGTVFKVTTNGTLTILVSFNTSNGFPYAGLVLGNGGTFYGTTAGSGGSAPYGTVFAVTTNGTLTMLHSFMGQQNEGGEPHAGLTFGGDGSLYGTT